MPAFDLDALLAPLPGDLPCGADPVHDPDFLALRAAMQGRPAQEFGAGKVEAVEPNWPLAQRLALALFGRCRDLRVAVALTRAGTRLHGLAGMAAGLALVEGLLERHWDAVHPQLDAEDGHDPTMRLNALAALASGGGVPPAAPELLVDARVATLDGARLGLSGRQLELAAGRAKPGPGETVPTPEGVARAYAEAGARDAGFAAALLALPSRLARIETLLQRRLGRSPDQLPDVAPLQAFVALAAAPLSQKTTTAPAAPDVSSLTSPSTTPVTLPPAGPPPVAAVGALHSREDVMASLQRAAEWIEAHEPGHPAPLLILRAQRLMSKSFLDIVKDILPDGLAQVQKLAGVESK